MPLQPDHWQFDPHSLGMARVGECVRFLAKNGYPYELNEANICFEPGQVLTVAEVNIGGWSSSYRFEGRGEATWNTVMFTPCDSRLKPLVETGTGSIGEADESGGAVGNRPAPFLTTIGESNND